jgi:hypothetical protein
MELRIDPEFEQLIQPLTPEELQQLTANLKADGCRDPLSVWPQEDGAALILDGHNRQRICSANNIPFDVTAVSLESRDEAVRWIINNQMGRRNLTEEQKSGLRGRRFLLEKKTEGAPEGNQHAAKQLSNNCTVVSDTVPGPTAERLAKEYHVSPRTILNDGEFVKGLDALKTIRDDLPKSVTTRRSQTQTRGKKAAGPKVTKARVISVGKLINELKVTPLPCMRRGDWQDFHILEAVPILAQLPFEEHQAIGALLSTPPIPPALGVQVLKNLRARGADGRQVIYQLFGSADPRERSLAQTLAAEVAPEPDPQGTIAERILVDVEKARDRLGEWNKDYAHEPWTDAVNTLHSDLKTMRATLLTIKERIRASHLERIAPYVQTTVAAGGNH